MKLLLLINARTSWNLMTTGTLTENDTKPELSRMHNVTDFQKINNSTDRN